MFWFFFQPPNYRKSKFRGADVMQIHRCVRIMCLQKIATFILHVGSDVRNKKCVPKSARNGQVVVCCIASLGAGAVMGLEAGICETWYRGMVDLPTKLGSLGGKCRSIYHTLECLGTKWAQNSTSICRGLQNWVLGCFFWKVGSKVRM